jgi:hypothetical protein
VVHNHFLRDLKVTEKIVKNVYETGEKLADRQTLTIREYSYKILLYLHKFAPQKTAKELTRFPEWREYLSTFIANQHDEKFKVLLN